MKALILAGGRGARLQPFTTVLPKPMLPMGDYPILEILLRQLKHAGVTEVVLAIGYLGYIIQSYFQDGARLGVKIHYSLEEKALGTAGPIGLTLDRLGEDFLIMNGDLLTTIDFKRIIDAHVSSGAAATIATAERKVSVDFGVLQKTPEGDLDRYIEKPSYAYEVSMGINLLKRSAIEKHIRPGEFLDLPDLMMKLRTEGKRVQCVPSNCFWLDLGRLEDYRTGAEIFESRKNEFIPNGA